ncbi:hypothetical protein JTE90_024673 [Oedothorax gibbosus]|uniref:C2H2-type domain-containing protein n=1 Tax=Oedothorax gibbosus TaxID=931172 RepID=A0AAV6TVR1_9ARAC|nr:hypothetical protein JTE90_024673 [Oedothorax gibbosus]
MMIQRPLRTTSLLTSNSATITSNSRPSMVNAGASTSAVTYSHGFGPTSLPNVCDKCRKTFSNKSHLTRHMKTHAEDSIGSINATIPPTMSKTLSPSTDPTFVHVCDTCRKTFSKKSNLTRHMKNHAEGSIGFDCKVCDKFFTREDNLTRHMKSHDSEEHVCPKCPKSFIRKDKLAKHMATHNRPVKRPQHPTSASGWAMSQPLPVSSYEWVAGEEISEETIKNCADDADKGYILEVDLDYPKTLHDAHNAYPLAPEQLCLTYDDKRWLCEDSIRSYAYGHYRIAELLGDIG